MDKNTVTAMLLMGAVILGFMWLNKPSEEELARQREAAEAQMKAQETDSQSPVLTVDSITDAEKAQITSTISRLGVKDSASGVVTLYAPDATLTLDTDGKIDGTVTTDNGAVSMESILAADYRAYPAGTAAMAVANLRDAVQSAARYQVFARYLRGTESTVTLANDVLALEISNKGGAITSAKLKNYNRYDSTAVELISQLTGTYSFTLTTATQRFDTGEFFFTPVEATDTSVTMQLDLGNGAVWGLRYSLAPGEDYTVRMEVVQNGMDAVIPSSVASMDFAWRNKMTRNEAGRMFEERNSALYYSFANGDVEKLSESSSERKEINERIKWIGYKNQFFTALIVADDFFTTANLDCEVLEHDPSFLKEMNTDATIEYSNTKASPAAFTLFFGPNSYPLLSDLQSDIEPGTNLHFTNLIPLGWSLFRWINTLVVIPVFNFLGQFISSYGIIILLLTIFIKIILFPFTYKSYMSQAKMRVLAPEIKEINEKYPGNENAMKRQQETMALYSRAGASPFSGCLPMLLQLPILIAMFNFFPSAIELRGQSFLWAKDLSAPDAIVSWTTNIPFISGTFGNHISLFCLLMTVVNIIYTRINMQNQPGGNSMPGMKWMMYLMPVMFLVFFNNYASGLSYYYFLSLLITIGQTYIFRKVVDEDKVRATMRENAKKPRKKSGFMARLEEAQRRQQALLREQERQRAKKGR